MKDIPVCLQFDSDEYTTFNVSWSIGTSQAKKDMETEYFVWQSNDPIFPPQTTIHSVQNEKRFAFDYVSSTDEPYNFCWINRREQNKRVDARIFRDHRFSKKRVLTQVVRELEADLDLIESGLKSIEKLARQISE